MPLSLDINDIVSSKRTHIRKATANVAIFPRKSKDFNIWRRWRERERDRELLLVWLGGIIQYILNTTMIMIMIMMMMIVIIIIIVLEGKPYWKPLYLFKKLRKCFPVRFPLNQSNQIIISHIFPYIPMISHDDDGDGNIWERMDNMATPWPGKHS